MNWKLIFQLSLLGLAMAFATLIFIPTKIEPFFWILIFIVCAYIIAKRCPAKFFLHGFLVSLVNSVWITGAHVIFFNTYMAHHPEMASMSADMGMPNHPRLLMLLSGPFWGAISGLVLGLFCYMAARVMKKK